MGAVSGPSWKGPHRLLMLHWPELSHTATRTYKAGTRVWLGSVDS